MKKRKILSALLGAILLLTTTSTSLAGFSDVPTNADYAGALDRLSSLGIMTANGDGEIKPDALITKEQFSKVMVTAAGLKDTADAQKGTTIFPDVSPDSWASGYINVAVSKGYIISGLDGYFHPQDPLTFAQASTLIVKALGYGDADVTGFWPRSYMEKAKALGLTTGMSFNAEDKVPRWAAAVMIDRLMMTNIKAAAGAAAKTFAETNGTFADVYVLGNSTTMEKLAVNQVLTDKGTYYLKNTSIKMNLGSKYKISVDGDSITMAYDTLAPTSKISVISAVDTTITYKEGLKTKTMVLPDKTAYYYNGVKQSYEGLKALLQTNSSLVMTYNKDKTGFDVACIFDPVTSKPEVVSGTVVEDGKVGAIKVSKGLRIARNTIDISTATPVNTVGEIIKAVDLKDRDVLYQVSDIWGKNPYLLAVDNKITGEITGILPSNIAPKSLQIGGKSYEFSRYMNMEKYASLPTPFNIGDEVVLLLGNDGKVVDVRYPGDDSINDFAMVLNYTAKTSSGILTYGQGVYTVKLLHTNGTSATYESVTDPTYMKGTLVRYSKSTSGKVTLYSLSYASPGEVTVNKDERRIGSAFASDNIKIFNVIANDSGVDAKVQLLSWSELPSGLYPSGRITFTNQVGAFNDINAMTLSDIYNEQYSTAVIKKFDTTRTVTGGTYTYTYAYTMVVDGSDYKYTVQAPIEYADVASVLKVKVTAANKTVAYVSEVKFPGIQSTTSITAIDSKRALINGKIYLFKPGAQIYYKDNLGNINLQDVEDVEVGKTYGIVAVYLDKSLDSNGRIETILITQ